MGPEETRQTETVMVGMTPASLNPGYTERSHTRLLCSHSASALLWAFWENQDEFSGKVYKMQPREDQEAVGHWA